LNFLASVFGTQRFCDKLDSIGQNCNCLNRLAYWVPVRLLAGANGACQACVIFPIFHVPQRLAEFNATTQNFDFLFRTGWGIGRDEVVAAFGKEIFIVAIPKDGFEHIADFLLVTHLRRYLETERDLNGLVI
jgi:hypothetical protein